MRRGFGLRAYLAASHLITLFAKPILQRRLKRAKEHPTRWQEKLGCKLAPRPSGSLVWLHAVGLGEVLSLRGLITRMQQQRPDLSFLVTSTTAASAEVFAKNAPPRTIHQFLPLDAPGYRKAFLDHFEPDLCIWVEQDLWPGLVSDIARRGIPQCVVAARMNAMSFRSHQKAQSVYRDIYAAMALVTAQDAATAQHLSALGATIEVTGSLKPAAPALSCDPDTLESLRNQIGTRFIWAVSPGHDADIALAKQAHDLLLLRNPSALLIIVPRFPAQFNEATLPRWSKGQSPSDDDPVWVCDTFGDLGLVYRLAQAVLIGGTFSDVEGHNPWEAAALSTAIFHGTRIANFHNDFAQLADADAAVRVQDAHLLADALHQADLVALAENALSCVTNASGQTDMLATRLIQMILPRHV